MISIVSPADATDDEVAAVLAAIDILLHSNEAFDTPTPKRTPWREAGRLLTQGVVPTRLVAPTWGNIERLRRLQRGT